MASAFESADFYFAVFAYCKETIWNGNVLILLGGKEDNIAIHGLYRQWKMRQVFNILRKLFEVFMSRAFFCTRTANPPTCMNPVRIRGSPEIVLSPQEAFPAPRH